MLRTGRRAGASSVVVHVALASGDGLPRVGFAVGRAVGPAVTRNLVKRRLRHLVRERLDRLPPASRLVVRAQPAAATRSYAELAADLDRALERALTKVPGRAHG